MTPAQVKELQHAAGIAEPLTKRTPEQAKADKKAGIPNPIPRRVYPTDFKFEFDVNGSVRTTPWLNDPRVNRIYLDELIARHGTTDIPVYGKGGKSANGARLDPRDVRTDILASLRQRRSLQPGQHDKAVHGEVRTYRREGKASRPFLINGESVSARVINQESFWRQ